KRIRKKANQRISTLPRQGRQQIISTNHRRTRLFILLAIPLAIFISMIIVIPTIVVQVTEEAETDEKNPQQEEAVFNEMNVSTPLIEVSIKRTETDEVETIPLEQYVASVVASEMPAQFE